MINPRNDSAEKRLVRHVGLFALSLTAVTVISVWMLRDAWLALSFAVGALLSYVNFDWMRLGLRAALPDDPARISKTGLLFYLGRYALLALALYGIYRVPFASLEAALLGLLVLPAALMLESVRQIIVHFHQS